MCEFWKKLVRSTAKFTHGPLSHQLNLQSQSWSPKYTNKSPYTRPNSWLNLKVCPLFLITFHAVISQKTFLEGWLHAKTIRDWLVLRTKTWMQFQKPESSTSWPLHPQPHGYIPDKGMVFTMGRGFGPRPCLNATWTPNLGTTSAQSLTSRWPPPPLLSEFKSDLGVETLN